MEGVGDRSLVHFPFLPFPQSTMAMRMFAASVAGRCGTAMLAAAEDLQELTVTARIFFKGPKICLAWWHFVLTAW